MTRRRKQPVRNRDSSGTDALISLPKGDNMPIVEELPTMTRQSVPKEKPVAPQPAPAEKIEATIQTLTLQVPCMNGVTGYVRKRVDVTLTQSQAAKLKGILQALESKDSQLENGKYVANQMHALQWMLENIGVAQ